MKTLLGYALWEWLKCSRISGWRSYCIILSIFYANIFTGLFCGSSVILHRVTILFQFRIINHKLEVLLNCLWGSCFDTFSIQSHRPIGLRRTLSSLMQNSCCYQVVLESYRFLPCGSIKHMRSTSKVVLSLSKLLVALAFAWSQFMYSSCIILNLFDIGSRFLNKTTSICMPLFNSFIHSSRNFLSFPNTQSKEFVYLIWTENKYCRYFVHLAKVLLLQAPSIGEWCEKSWRLNI